MTKIFMRPTAKIMGDEESGIKRVVEAYERYLPEFGYSFTENRDEADLSVGHAGTIPNPDVSICHGLYWTADYDIASPKWEWAVNRDIIKGLRVSRAITVPSSWVRETFQRDMRLSPTVVPHGIEWDAWQGKVSASEFRYVLWNKNRVGVDVCSTGDLEILARRMPGVRFLSTFANHIESRPDNLTEIGLQPHDEMMKYVKGAGVYLATVKETFGIGILEAMAAGVPVLGWHGGGIEDLVRHGVNGYLASRGDFDSLEEGLEYCLRYRRTLGDNGREMAREFTWHKAMGKLHVVLDAALHREPPTVSVIIPCYNYGYKVGRAIESAINQTHKPYEIIVVDDGSNDENRQLTKAVCDKLGVTYIRKENGGVATARNLGIRVSSSKYVCCLDADDAIMSNFLEVCVNALESDRSISLAYTGLAAVSPDGKVELSRWPGEYNYDKFLKKQNQVPTCCVYTREMWERLGGYNQRYAPTGAGAEDAEFFLRAGAYGFGARKVTYEGLFQYTIGQGHTSRPEYREVDWLMLHPWVKDGLHPFASLATPVNGFSHPVRQYDEPLISVVIPVGPGHELTVRDALDSLESQSFRKWEAIVVFDNWDGDTEMIGHLEDYLAELETAYPYIRIKVNKDPHRGAGWARNRGAEMARAALLLFLDADDWLYPEALEMLYETWLANGGIVYCDYVGKAFVSKDMAEVARVENRLLEYNAATGEAVIQHHAAEYNCLRAQRQPDAKDMYIWNLITSLVPRTNHVQIGGFDESMESWEDWDYWIRMAKAGLCFYYLPKSLVVYRFYTGNRRETGLQRYPHLLQYLQDKYSRSGNVPCKSCGGNRTDTNPGISVQPVQKQISNMSDNDFVLVSYVHRNLGQHRVFGAVTKTNYGYRGGGGKEQFYVHKDDIAAQPDIFVPVVRAAAFVAQPAPAPAPVPAPIRSTPDAPPAAPTPAPKPVATLEPTLASGDEADLQLVPGISDNIARELNALGIYNVGDIKKLSIGELLAVKGVGKARAAVIREYLDKLED